MKKLFLAVCVLFFTFAGFNLAHGATIDGPEDLKEYLRIFNQYDSGKTLKESVEVVYPKIIKEYQEFIKKYPKSRLVDDAKLRIAEFYGLTGADSGDKAMHAKIKFNDNWRGESAKWLTDIILNHSLDKLADSEGVETKEYTAAFAFYYLYAWYSKDKNILENLIQHYPKSEPARWARDILSRK